jgi:hypothetical protein
MPVTQVEDTGNGATFSLAVVPFSVLIKKINGWEEKREPLDVTALNKTGMKKSIPGDLTEPVDVTVEFYWDTSKPKPPIGREVNTTASAPASTPETATITSPLRTHGGEAVAANYAGSGHMTSIKWPELENGTVQVGSFVFRFDGVTGPTWTPST